MVARQLPHRTTHRSPMTTDERIEAIAKTLEQTTGVLATLAGTVAVHDRQIGTILKLRGKRPQLGTTPLRMASLPQHPAQTVTSPRRPRP